MFYDLYHKNKRYSQVSGAGRWNLDRLTDLYMRVIESSGLKPGKALELGPGEGLLARRLRDAGYEYTGVDRSPGLVEKLRGEGFEVSEGTVPPVAHPDGVFDLVCCVALLEHMPTYNDGIELVAECRRVLRPGGVLLLAVPDLIRGGIDFINWDYTHAFAQTPFRLQQVMTDGDFEIERTIGLTGSLSNRLIRLPIDLMGFLVHTRFVYWLASGLRLESLTNGFHKTFQPAILTLVRKAE